MAFQAQLSAQAGELVEALTGASQEVSSARRPYRGSFRGSFREVLTSRVVQPSPIP